MYQKWKIPINYYIESHRQELVDMLIRIINVPSVKGKALPEAPFGEGPKLALLEGISICEENGLIAYNHGNMCGSALFSVPNAKKEIAFISHLDVVPAGEGWMSDPFVGIERNGFVVGRGSRDNKAGFVASLLAVKALRDLRIPLRSDVRIVMGCDEESGMADMDYFADHGPISDFSIVTDCYFPVSHGEKGILHGDIVIPLHHNSFVFQSGMATNIIPDLAVATLKASDCAINKIKDLAQNNSLIDVQVQDSEIKIIAKGVSAHVSEPESAKNANLILVDFLLETGIAVDYEERSLRFIQACLEAYYGEFFGLEYEDKASGKTTCVGSMLNSRNNELRLNINIRYAVSDHHDRFLPLIYKTCEHWGYAFDLHEASAPYYQPPDRREIIKLTEIYQDISGDNREAYVVAGGTYARKLPNAIAFGPGSPDETFPYPLGHGDAHQPDESQDISVLQMAAKIYALSIIELDQLLNG